ncbi:MAG: lipopolysaccharide heptosyltransferase II [Gammaproteobacteria bacterium]
MTAILVVGPSWVGDMVMAQSLLRILKDRAPETKIDVLAPTWSRALLERMPEVRMAVDMPLRHGELKLRSRHRIGGDLRLQRYSQAIVIPNSLKSALVPWWAKIPRRTGYLGELRWGLLNDVRRLDVTAVPQTVKRFAALGYERTEDPPDSLPRPTLQVEQHNIDAALQRLTIPSPRQPVLALCPGAEFGPAKRWPVEYFVQVANAVGDWGWQVWLFGSARDAVQGQRIAAQVATACLDLTGQTSLAETVDLMSLAAVVVTNDSGLMHVAAALDCNLVALFGSSSPEFTPPLHPRAKVLRLGLTCSPCFARECPLGHLKCLRGIKPKRVLDAIAGFDDKKGKADLKSAS